MTRTPNRYFEKMYSAGPDPWGYETKWYEQRKYALTVAALSRRRYRRAFEPGCSIGVLTELLVPRCDELIALELVPQIAARAARRNPGVDVRVGRIPEDWPDGRFDLVVFSEVLYYLDAEDIFTVIAQVERGLDADGEVIAVHYTGETDYPLTGAQVHDLLNARGWRRRVHHVDDLFLLSVFEAK